MLWHKVQGAGGTGGGGGIEFVGATSATGTDVLSLSGITDLQPGDTVIFVAQADNAEEFDRMIFATGWSGMSPDWPLESTALDTITYLVAYKVMGNPVDTQAEVLNAADVLSAIAFRNAGTPPSAADRSQTVTAGDDFSLSSFTVAQNGSVFLVVAMIDDDNDFIDPVPTGFTVAVESGRLGGSTALMYKLVDAGATGTISGSWHGAGDALLTLGYAIGPA